MLPHYSASYRPKKHSNGYQQTHHQHRKNQMGRPLPRPHRKRTRQNVPHTKTSQSPPPRTTTRTQTRRMDQRKSSPHTQPTLAHVGSHRHHPRNPHRPTTSRQKPRRPRTATNHPDHPRAPTSLGSSPTHRAPLGHRGHRAGRQHRTQLLDATMRMPTHGRRRRATRRIPHR